MEFSDQALAGENNPSHPTGEEELRILNNQLREQADELRSLNQDLEFRSDWGNAYGLERIVLQADVQIGPYFRLLPSPKLRHKASPGISVTVPGTRRTTD